MKSKQLTTLLLLSNTVFSQTTTWTTSPFDQKIFIKNKGQSDLPLYNRGGKLGNEPACINASLGRREKFLFGAFSERVDLYSCTSRLTYKHLEFVLSWGGFSDQLTRIATN